jgi:hypothetical protein
VHGDYVKYSNNDGWSEDRRNTPHAFSHFTYEASGRSLVVCDIQGARLLIFLMPARIMVIIFIGVGDLYTDPQIHTIDGRGMGLGNNGAKGIQRWVASHRCNSICRQLKLPQVGADAKPGGVNLRRASVRSLPI